MPQKHLYTTIKKLPIDLSLSENPLGCSSKVLHVLKTISPADCFNYPDPRATPLIAALSHHFHIPMDSILMANGSEALIKLIPQALLKPGETALIPRLTFPLFDSAVTLAGGKVIHSRMTPNLDIDLDDIKSKLTPPPKLIFLCNPNNPTGKTMTKASIVNLLQQTSASVIVDEANIEFGGQTVIDQVKKLTNLIVIRTFSKALGLAGLRLGFCVAHPKLIRTLKQISQVFPVSTLAQKAALAALQDHQFINRTKALMDKEGRFLTQELRSRGLHVIDSNANNLFVKVTPLFSSSTACINRLNSHGVSVVNGLAFGQLGKNFIRISPRSHQINIRFLNIIDQL